MSAIHLETISHQAVDQRRIASRRSIIAEGVERTAGFLLLAGAGPAIAISALVVRALSGCSPFVAHLRVGRHGKLFWMWKLRTMWQVGDPALLKPGWVEHIVADTEEEGKSRFDPRVSSRFAAFCRRHSLDELPQLWHVFRGQMALVGPRPLTRSELDRFYGKDVSQLLSVKPGLTGLWQVYGRSAIKFPERARMDLQLVRALKPKLYFRVLLRTIPAVIRGNGAW